MSRSTTKYGLGTEITREYPWGVNVKARVLCSDGVVRRTKRIAKTADTFFSTPAAVEVRGSTVAGYVTCETTQGFSTETPDDPAVLKFFAYKYRRNAGLLP